MFTSRLDHILEDFVVHGNHKRYAPFLNDGKTLNVRFKRETE